MIHNLSEPNCKFGAETEEVVKKVLYSNNLYIRKTIDENLKKHIEFELVD